MGIKGLLVGMILAGSMMPVNVLAVEYCAFNKHGTPMGCYGTYTSCKKIADRNGGYCEVKK